MRIEGSFNVKAARTDVWRNITDPEIMGRCIPGCQSITVTGPDTYQANIEVKLGPIKTTFNVDVEVTEEVEPDHVISRTRGEEGSRASTISAENRLELSDADSGGTDVYYCSEVAIAGRLGKYGHGIMKKVAKNLSDKFVDRFREQIATDEAA